MGRRRRRITTPGKKKFKPKTKTDTTKRTLMLNTGKLDSFKFNLKNMLADVDGGGAIYANILSKFTNIGFDASKEYLDTGLENKNLSTEKHGEIIDLLKKSSKYR